jgi:hypothetical protein
MSCQLNSQVIFGTHPVCFTEGGDYYALNSCTYAGKAGLLLSGRSKCCIHLLCSFMLSSEHVKDGFSAIGDDYDERIWTVHGLGQRRSLTAIIAGSQSTCGERD